jgi:2-(1,2-epoxy-1,2-dihydrophenyl)acetyl-CoA isomerase
MTRLDTGTEDLLAEVDDGVAVLTMNFSERISAADAERLGILSAVFPAADFEAEIRARATRLANGPRIAYRYMKENLNRAVTGELRECIDLEVTHHLHTGRTEDHREAAKAFTQRREPRFNGR